MAITITRLTKGMSWALRTTAEPVEICTLDLATGDTTSAYLTPRELSRIKSAALQLFDVVPAGPEREASARTILSRVVAVSAVDDATLALTAPVSEGIATLTATPNTYPASVLVRIPWNAVDGLSWAAGDILGGGPTTPPFTTTGPMSLYVSPTGNNANSGLSEDAPLQSITEALKKVPFLVQPGHPVTINLAAGTYDEKIVCPAFILQDNIKVVGPSMVPTAPSTGIDSGTFDVSFGTQDFPHRAVVTDAGWAVGGLTGGWFVEVLSGANTGACYPIVYNTATTLDMAFPCAPVVFGAIDLQGVQFRLVKPTATLTRATANQSVIDSNAPIMGRVIGVDAPSSITVGAAASSAYLWFENIALQRANSSYLVRGAGGATMHFSKCVFHDTVGGGGTLVGVSNQSTFRFDDCLFFRAALRNNTAFIGASVHAAVYCNRHGAHGANYVLQQTASCSASFSSGFFYGQDVAVSCGSDSRCSLSNVGINAPFGCVQVTDWGSLSLNNCTLRNATVFGIAAGFQNFGTSFASSPVSGGTCVASGILIDNCARGVILGANCDFNIASVVVGPNPAINNCTTAAINMAGTLRSGHNVVSIPSTFSMSGNAIDITLDNGVTSTTLADFRLLSPKALTDSGYFNRFVQP